MGWLGERTEERADPQTPVAGRQDRGVAGAQLRAGRRSARGAEGARARGDLGLCPGPRLSRGDEDQAQGARPLHLGHLPARPESLRRHRAADGKARGAGGRATAGRASTPTSCRASSARGCSWASSCCRSSCRPTTPETDHCGQCRACLDICPTNAFPAPYRLDARRCISYLTIEHEGPIDRELRPLLGNRIYGCDDCLAVCPWNKFAQQARETALAPRPALDAPLLAELATLDDAEFRRRFAGTTIKRIGRDRFLRNVAYALGNSGVRETALPAVEKLLKDPSPLVRGAAVWALSRLAPNQVAQRQRMTHETDAGVCAEWSAARNIREQRTGP